MDKILYDYQDFFKELAENITEMGEEQFSNLVKDNFADNMHYEMYGDKETAPVSFFAMLSANYDRSNSMNNPTYEKIKQVFELGSNIPTDFIFPHFDSSNQFLFRSVQDLNEQYSMLCWKVFNLAEEGEAIGNDVFQQVLDIMGGDITKVTRVLFLINPDEYFPIDDNLTMLRYDVQEIKNKIIDNNNKDNAYDTYCQQLQAIKAKFPQCSFAEINHLLSLIKTGDIKITDTYCLIDTKAHGANNKDYIGNISSA